MGKEKPQSKPIDPKSAQQGDARAIFQSLLDTGQINQQEYDQFVAGLPSAAQGVALRLQNTFLDNLRKDPSELSRWQGALGRWQTALGNAPNYTQGYVDDSLVGDTSRVFSTIANSPNGNQDPYAALDAMTKSAAAAPKAPGSQRLMPKFTPASGSIVEAGMESAFQKALGRAPTPSELKAFTQTYASLEAQQYTQSVNAVGSPTGGGTVQDLGSPEQVAYHQVENSPEAVGYAARQVAQTIGDAIRKGY